MNGLQVFRNQEFGEVRTAIIDGEPWFVAADVCKALEITTEQTRRLEEDEKALRSMQTLGGVQNMLTVNEPGLYALVLGSRKPEAKAFKRWITHEVLPSIRETGTYIVPKTLPEALRLAADLAEQIEADKPKVLFAEKCMKSEDSILIRELAKIACDRGFLTGEHRLYKMLREWGLLTKANEPYQRYVQAGYFETTQATYDTSAGIKLALTTRVLPKGQAYILNRLAN